MRSDRRRRIWAALLLGAALARVAEAAPDSPAEAAQKALAAIEAKDAGALRGLAERDEPDPWIVADELLFLGEPEAAEAFARAAPRKDVEALPAYLAGRRGVPYDKEARAALERATVLLEAGRAAEALAVEERFPPVGGDLIAVRRRFLRGEILSGLGRPRDSADAYEAAAAEAATLGWLQIETRSWARVAIQARGAGAIERALEACGRQRALAERRGNRKGLAQSYVNAGQTYSSASRFDEALASFAQAAGMFREGRDEEGLGWVYNHTGLIHEKRRDPARAREAFREAGKLFENAGSRFACGVATWNTGRMTWLLGEVAAAIPLLERGLELEAAEGTSLDRLGLGQMLALLGLAYEEAGRFEEALDRMGRALEIAERAGRVADAARILCAMASVRHETGEVEASADLDLRALERAEASGDPSMIATALNDAGIRRMQCGLEQDAKSLLVRAIGIHERLGDREGQAAALSNLSQALLTCGDAEGAVEAGERAREIRTRLGNRRGLARTLSVLGKAYGAAGRVAEGLAIGHAALRIAEGETDPALLAMAIRGLEDSYTGSGEAFVAVRLRERLVQLFEERGPCLELADALACLSICRQNAGDAAGAQEALNRAREIFAVTRAGAGRRGLIPRANLAEAMLLGRAYREAAILLEGLLDDYRQAGSWRSVSEVMLMIAQCRSGLGESDEAVRWEERALEACANRDGALEARTLTELGWQSERTGEIGKALDCYERAARLEDGAGLHHRQAWTRALAAILLLKTERWRDAALAARKSVELLGRMLETASEEAGIHARGQLTAPFVVGALAARRLGDVEESAYFYEAGRAGLLRDGLARRAAAVSAALPPEFHALERDCRAQIASAVADARSAEAAGNSAAREAAQRALEQARDNWHDVVARMQQASRIASDVAFPRPDPLPAIRSRLRPFEALLLYATPRGEVEEASALVITRESAREVLLGPTGAIDAACAALRAGDAASDPTEAAAALRRLVVDPLGLDAKTERLLVSPEGSLSYVPFALLAGEREVVFVPSGTTYGALLPEAGKRGEGVLALGDPDYGAKPSPDLLLMAEAHRGSMSLPPLPATAEEARAVGTKVLLGKEATVASLREALRTKERWRAIHFACHGLFDVSRPSMTALALTPAEGDDGFLTALDVMGMKASADLVVLSGCETGLGQVTAGEGIVGLSRSFMVAGAPRVLASLWKVDDEATRALMAGFYASWNGGLSPAASLKRAQAAVRAEEKWSHPRFWAGWVLWGLGD